MHNTCAPVAGKLGIVSNHHGTRWAAVVPMGKVTKKDLSAQDFDGDKIRRSVEAAARGAGLPEMRVRDLVEAVSRRAARRYQWEHGMSTGAIREEILRLLDEAEPAASRQWRLFETARKRRA